MINHPTHHFFGYSTQWRPSCSCSSSQEGRGIYTYILWYIITYIYVWGFSRANQWSTCLASQHNSTCEMHIWEHANTGIRHAEACLVRPCVDICHIQWCIWIYVCKGHDWAHICLTYVRGWTCPTLLIQRPVTSVIPSRHGQGRSPYVTGTMMVILLITLDSFSRTVPFDGWLGIGIICYISF